MSQQPTTNNLTTSPFAATAAAPCPICRGGSRFDFETNYHRVHRCENRECGHLFAVGVAANTGVMTPESDTGSEYAIYEKRNEHLIRYWKRKGFLRDGYRVLDFGSGTGHIVKSLKQQMKLEIICIESGVEYHAKLKELGCQCYENMDQLNSTERFDAALMIEVVEHLDQPVKVLQEVRNHLKPGGQLFLTTPAGDLRTPVPEPWKQGAHNTPHHIQYFTPSSLPLALRLAGFRHARYRFINELYPNEEMSQAVYESLWAKKYAVRKQFSYWRYGANHLTFFAN